MNLYVRNFQFGGYPTQNVDFLPNTHPSQKSTLLVKILPDNPETENLPLIHLRIYKKIFISGLSNPKCGFFTHKRTPSKINFISKNFAQQPRN